MATEVVLPFAERVLGEIKFIPFDSGSHKGKDRYVEFCEVEKPEDPRITQSDASDASTIVTSASSSNTRISQGSDSVKALVGLDKFLAEKLGKSLEIVASNGDLYAKQAAHDKGSIFEGGAKHCPDISLRRYVHRLLRYIDAGNGSIDWNALSPGARAFLVAVIYIDRIVQKTDIIINSLRIHRLISIGILIALKMHEDAIVDMHFFASLAGVTFAELKRLESEFLRLIDWDIVVSGEEFSARIEKWKALTASKSPKSA